MKKLIFTALVIIGMVVSSAAQDRKPAMAKKPSQKTEVQAPGYLPNTASNKQQDRQLKKLNDEDKQAFKPKVKKTIEPKTNQPKPKGEVSKQ